jgi:lipoate-protein ligase A
VHLLDLTLDSPAANIALDEALLDEAEAEAVPRETLRLWQPAENMVVVGRGSPASDEVDLNYCRQQQIHVLRRSSGGAAIVTGSGCLMYALVLSLKLRSELRSLDRAHQFVLETLGTAISALVPGVHRHGTSDLAFALSADALPSKCSGNSVRIKKHTLLYHGTLLYRFPLPLISACLATAPRQPAYRAGRNHDQFVANLPTSAGELKQALASAWNAHTARTDWPEARVQSLLAGKYQTPEWSIQV